MRSRGLVAVVIGTAASLLIVVPASALQWGKNSAGVSVVCFTGTGLSSVEDSAAAEAAKAWNGRSKGLRVTYKKCDAGANTVPIGFGKLNGGQELGLTQYQYNPATEELATASIIYDREAITQFTTALANATGDTVESLSPVVWLAAMCHEMGHALGLEHTTKKDSCMQTNIAQVPVGTPGTGDVTQLQTYYGPGETEQSSTTEAPTTVAPTTTPTTIPTTVPPTTVETTMPEEEEESTDPGSTTDPDEPESTDDDTTDTTVTTVTTVTTIVEEEPATEPEEEAEEEEDDGDVLVPVDDSDTTLPSTTVPRQSVTSTTKPSTEKGGHKSSDRSHGDKTPRSCGTRNSDVSSWRDHVKKHKSTLSKQAKADHIQQIKAKREEAFRRYLESKAAAREQYMARINASRNTTQSTATSVSPQQLSWKR